MATSRRVEKNRQQMAPASDSGAGQDGKLTPEETQNLAKDDGTGNTGVSQTPFVPSSSGLVVRNTADNRNRTTDPRPVSGANPNWKFERDFGKVVGPDNSLVYYYGPKLVDENMNLVDRTEYTEDDIGAIWRDQKTPEQRASFFDTLYRSGAYGNNKPSAQALSGAYLMSEDSSAIWRMLNAAVSARKTASAYIKALKTGAPLIAPGGTGSGIRVVSSEDAGRMYKQASLRILGRVPTAQEMEESIRYIQQQQRARASGGQDAPSVQTAALERAGQVAPGEATAQTVGTGLQRIMALLGGR